MQSLARQIAERWGRRHCLLTGHGSTAIYLALKAIEARHGTGEVLVPAIGCASIAQIILYAGFAPRFTDVTLDDFTMDVASLRASITPEARAILPVHLYGHACDMDAINAIAAEHALPVIEDAAQSLGGVYDDRLLGSIGDFAIFSFGGTKAVAAGGGGALLFDDDDHAETILRELDALPEFASSAETALLAHSHANLWHATVDYLRLHPDEPMEWIWQRAAPLYRDLYFHRFPADPSYAQAIERGLGELDARNAARLRRAERYDELLAVLPIQRPDAWRRSRSIWRYSFLLRSAEETIRVSNQLRRNGVNASNHYWSLADVFLGVKSLPHAREVESRIVNFWVDHLATDEAIDRGAQLLATMLR